MSKKIIPIKYTSREFESIKNDLLEHARRYYPDTFKDFNEGSFGSLMIDTVAYIGDILSFYLDYQANESFLETAAEYENIIKLAKELGYKHSNGTTSSGIATFYISVPAKADGLGPDFGYAPILRKGSVFSTKTKTTFILNEDVRFDLPTNEVRVLKVNNFGTPTSYGIKSYGLVISGVIRTERIPVGDYQKYLKIRLAAANVCEVMTVFDTEGNEYYEVDYLSQNIIYRPFINKDAVTAQYAKEILKPYMVPRRFTVEADLDNTFLQFGASSDVILSDANNMLAEPSRSVLNLLGKQYISSDFFDPTKLINSDKMGVGPSNTTLAITYRFSPTDGSINFGPGSLNNVESPIFIFKDEQELTKGMVQAVKDSIEVTNEAPLLGDVITVNSEELKIRVRNSLATQSRAVTAADYRSLAYTMPTSFGSIKRVNVVKDSDSLKRNINMYILSEDKDGKLIVSNQIIKNNLKNWLLKNKIINDTIDILDGKVINYEIEFVAVGSPDKSKYDTLAKAIAQLRTDFKRTPEFGESLNINDILTSLKKVDSIVDVTGIKLNIKNGGKYSSTNFNLNENMSADKRFVNVPLNAIMELKYPDSDIKGTII